MIGTRNVKDVYDSRYQRLTELEAVPSIVLQNWSVVALNLIKRPLFDVFTLAHIVQHFALAARIAPRRQGPCIFPSTVWRSGLFAPRRALIGACLVTLPRRRALPQVAAARGPRRSTLPANITHHMTKPAIQEGASETEAQEPRKLNMEEKRKLEKLLLSDIDTAVARYNEQAEGTRQNLIDKLTKNPPAEVKKLFDGRTLARKQVEQLEAKLDTLGFDIDYHGELQVNRNGTMTAQLSAYDKLVTDMRAALLTLKRNYVIKLFADHADTQSLFASLAKDLEKLIG